MRLPIASTCATHLAVDLPSAAEQILRPTGRHDLLHGAGSLRQADTPATRESRPPPVAQRPQDGSVFYDASSTSDTKVPPRRCWRPAAATVCTITVAETTRNARPLRARDPARQRHAQALLAVLTLALVGSA